MYSYLITILCLRQADDRTETFTKEADAIALWDEFMDKPPEEVVQVMMTTLNTDAVQATVNRNWRRP